MINVINKETFQQEYDINHTYNDDGKYCVPISKSLLYFGLGKIFGQSPTQTVVLLFSSHASAVLADLSTSDKQLNRTFEGFVSSPICD